MRSHLHKLFGCIATLVLVAGTSLTANGVSLAAEHAGYSGTALEYRRRWAGKGVNAIKVDVPLPSGHALRGAWMALKHGPWAVSSFAYFEHPESVLSTSRRVTSNVDGEIAHVRARAETAADEKVKQSLKERLARLEKMNAAMPR